MGLFKSKKKIENNLPDEKTIKLSDLIYVLDNYIETYNDCMAEVGRIIVSNGDDLFDATYHTLFWNLSENGGFETSSGSYQMEEINPSIIKNWISLYASEYTKTKIAFLENACKYHFLENIQFNYIGINTKIEMVKYEDKIATNNNFDLYFKTIVDYTDPYKIIENFSKENPDIVINNATGYNHYIKCLNKYKNTYPLFDENGNLYDRFKGRKLENFDFSLVDFNNKNISGLDVNKNPNIHINFDKIVKDVSDCNFNGYDLRKETFRSFDIRNTDFRNTGATIDIATCTINKEGKMNSGTLFDEDNKFVFIDKKLTLNQVRDLSIKIKKLERN